MPSRSKKSSSSRRNHQNCWINSFAYLSKLRWPVFNIQIGLKKEENVKDQIKQLNKQKQMKTNDEMKNKMNKTSEMNENIKKPHHLKLLHPYLAS